MTLRQQMEAGSFGRNLVIWGALMLLLAMTAGSAYLRLGAWNLVANLAIAAAKAMLVAIYFMHLRAPGALVRIGAVLGLFMLILLFSLGAADYLNRRIYAAPWQVPQQLQPVLSRRN